MDIWKHFAITHELLDFLNPMSAEKFDEIVELLALPADARVLDIACGKAELLVRCARRWNCHAVGVDISPNFVADSRARIKAEGRTEQIEIIEANGADYDAKPESFDATFCIGASWIWGGHEATLKALAAATRPGGVVMVGEPYWHKDPSPEYLEAAGTERRTFGSYRENVETGLAQGLGFLHAVASTLDEWDRYEGYKTLASERRARTHPDDELARQTLEIVRAQHEQYRRWGRDELGWAVYLFLKDPL